MRHIEWIKNFLAQEVIPFMKPSHIKQYTTQHNFNLACRRTLHSTTKDTPLEHEHFFYELVVVVSGTGINRMDGLDYKLSAGNVFLIQPHHKHWYTRYNNLEIFNLVFGKQFFMYFLPELTQLPGFQLLFNVAPGKLAHAPGDGIRLNEKAFPEIVAILTEMDHLNCELRPGVKSLLLADFLRVILLISLHAHWAGEKNSSSHVGSLTNVLSVLEERFPEEWSLTRMAKVARMGVSSFRQEFLKLTGTSPIQYLLQLRLEKARFLIDSTDTPLEQIALECGFSNGSYFSRQFTKEYHVRPSQYRKEQSQRLQDIHKLKGF